MTLPQLLWRFITGGPPTEGNDQLPPTRSGHNPRLTNPAIDNYAEDAMKPSPAPPPYVAAMPESELPSEQQHDPADLDTAKEVSHNDLSAHGIPLSECKGLFDNLNDVNNRLGGRGDVLRDCIHALNLYTWCRLSSLPRHIAKLTRDVRNLAEEIKRAHDENARTEISSVPLVDEHALCTLLEKITLALETWLDQVDDIMLADDGLSEEAGSATQKAFQAHWGEAPFLDDLCQTMSARCSILRTKLRRRRVLPASEWRNEARKSSSDEWVLDN